MANDILVSICCITYNHEDYIADAIEGFLMQNTNFKYEVLIHDDASTDRTAEIIRKYEKKFPDLIKPIYQTKNQHSKGIKVGKFNTERAIGKYIALCEGDDYWVDPCKLQEQVCFMEKNQECTLCCHDAYMLDARSKMIYKTVRPRNGNGFLPIEQLIADGGCIPTASFVYPRRLVLNRPDYLNKVSVGDYPLQMYLGSLGKVYYIDKIMSVYRTNVKGSWTMRTYSGKNSNSNAIKHNINIIQFLDAFDVNTGYKFTDSINEAKMLRELAILMTEGKLQEIKSGKYVAYYNALGFKEKAKLHASCYFPKIYRQIARFKRKIGFISLKFKSQYQKPF